MAAEDNVSRTQGEYFMNTSLEQAPMINNQDELKQKGTAIESEEGHMEEKIDLSAKQAAMMPNLNNLDVNEPPTVSEASNVNLKHDAGLQCVQRVIYDALPVSSVIPEDYNYEKYGDPQLYNYDVYDHEVTSDIKALTKSDRQQNWYMETRPRKSGILDKYYTHLPSDIRCRSLMEVYNFVEFGSKSIKEQPHSGDNEETRSLNHQKPTGDNEEGSRNDVPTQRVAKKQRGSSLVEPVETGYYVPPCENSQSCAGHICRRQQGEPETNTETKKAAKKGRRRKKGEEKAAENENKGESSPSPNVVRIHTLIYDFVPTK